MSTDTNPDLIMCGTCGDEFTQHDRGTCGNCMAGETAALHVEIERLRAERDALRAELTLQAWIEKRCTGGTGTNLLTAEQAKQMLAHVLGDVLAEAAKSERRAITFGDIVQSQVIAMRAAVVAANLEGLDVGIQWIANTLCGPGHLPDIDEARALGGAQALWDKETAEHEAFRAAHPAP